MKNITEKKPILQATKIKAFVFRHKGLEWFIRQQQLTDEYLDVSCHLFLAFREII